MRVLVILLSSAVVLFSIPLALAEEDSGCSRGPYEMRMPANTDCCGYSKHSFCLWHCTVWANNPVGVGPDVCLQANPPVEILLP